jgi:hypothetical protein
MTRNSNCAAEQPPDFRRLREIGIAQRTSRRRRLAQESVFDGDIRFSTPAAGTGVELAVLQDCPGRVM